MNSLFNIRLKKIFLSLLMVFSFYQNLEGTFINRFNGTLNGGIAYTGNAVGLSKETNQNNAGTRDAIGAFSTINTALQVGTYPPGTTLLVSENSAAAVLDLPTGSNVIYAELVISGSYGFPETPTPPPPPPPNNVSVLLTDPLV